MSGLWRGWISLDGGNGLYTGSFSLWNGDSGLIDDNPGETPPDAITTPLLADAADPNLPGDWRPVYEIDFVDPYPTGGGIGDILQGRWGDSEAEAELMTPEEATISESWWIDGVEPFPALGDFGGSQPLGTDVTYQVRIRRGSLYSAWSAFKTLEIVDGVMTAPGWTDLTNQTASTRVWSSGVTVAGMATGAYARLLGTGPLKVGSTVYEAGTEVLVQNGDTLYAGVDTSATGGATVNNVVTNRGAALETFSATTAGAAADFTVTGAPNVQNIDYASTNADFNNVQMNAGRNIIFVAGNLNNTSITVTIDGSSSGITLIDKVATGIENVFAYEVTIGANDTKDIRISGGSVLKTVGIVVGVLSNAAAGAPSVVKLSFNWRAEPISIGTMTIPADGIGIACAVNIDSATSSVWTGATEISDNSATTISLTSAKLTATANPTVAAGSGTWAYQFAGALGLIFDNA